jgi:rRNA-processing protein FCF1
MLITPRPGVDRDYLLNSLRTVQSNVATLRGAGGPSDAHKRLLAYLEWTSNAVRMLGNQISSSDLERLVLTRRYELLLSGIGTMRGNEMEVQRVVNDLVALELDQRVDAFDAAIKTLDAQIRRWSGLGDFVVLDSSFYIHHPEKLEDADIGSAAKVPGTSVHVLVPMVIVDELDGLKRQNKQAARWRAGYTVAVLDRVFKNTTVGRLHAEDITAPTPDGLGQGLVTMELLFDPPGHVRLPINDDEIVDRTVAVQTLAGRKVTLLTYDTGQSTRARNAGLQVVKLSEDIGEEPK